MTDILVKNGYILTMTGEGVGMIEDGAVAIEGNEIVAVGKTDELKRNTAAPRGSSTPPGRRCSPGS